MMKSPLPKHQKEFYDEAERLSKESGTPGDYDRDNPEVIWDGPLDQTGRPHGVGSSSGITGMQVLKAKSYYDAKPITQCAKVYK